MAFFTKKRVLFLGIVAVTVLVSFWVACTAALERRRAAENIRVLNGHVLYFAGKQGNYSFLTWERPHAKGFRKWLEHWLAADLIDSVLTVSITNPERSGLDGETPSREEMLAMIPLIRQLRFAKVRSRNGTPAAQIFISSPNVDADLVKQFREAFPDLRINSEHH